MPAFAVVKDLNAVVAYPAAPQVALAFKPDTLLFRVETGVPGVYISLDGTTDFLHITPADGLVKIRCRLQELWLKEDANAASTCRVSAITDA
jgi:hypothetical protein